MFMRWVHVFEVLGSVLSIPVGLWIARGFDTGFLAAYRELYMILTWWLRKPFYILECKIALWGKDTEYITAYKRAYVVYDSESKTYGFAPMRLEGDSHLNRRYGTEATAVCDKGSGHQAPLKACECGFYALKLRRHLGKVVGSDPQTGLWRANALATLEVDLSGTVISGSLGYRAEKQRVLKVQLSRRCSICYFNKHFWQRAKEASSISRVPWRDSLVYIIPICEVHQGENPTDISVLKQILHTDAVWR